MDNRLGLITVVLMLAGVLSFLLLLPGGGVAYAGKDIVITNNTIIKAGIVARDTPRDSHCLPCSVLIGVKSAVSP